MERIIFEYILCYLAQCFIIMLGVYAFCAGKLNASSTCFGVGIVFVGRYWCAIFRSATEFTPFRLMMITALVSIWYLKFPINRSIRQRFVYDVDFICRRNWEQCCF